MRQLLLMMLILPCLILSCSAAGILEEQAQLAQTDELTAALPDEAAALMGEASPTDSDGLEQGLERIWSGMAEAGRQWLPQSLRQVGLLVVVVLLCTLVRSVGVGSPRILTATGVLALVGLCTQGLSSVFAVSMETLDQLHVFSTALLATLSTAMASAGAPTSGAALYAGTVFFLNLLLRLIPQLLQPLVYGFLAAGTGAVALGNETLRRVGDLLKWVVTLCLKTLSTVFIGYLTITGVVSGSADNTAVKAVKLAVSTAVPVVGSILSDASETVLVSAGLLKNAAGVFGLLGALAICAVPFVRIGLQYLGLKLAAALSAVVDTLSLAKVLDVLSSAMGMMLAMTAVALLLVVFSCACALQWMSR